VAPARSNGVDGLEVQVEDKVQVPEKKKKRKSQKVDGETPKKKKTKV